MIIKVMSKQNDCLVVTFYRLLQSNRMFVWWELFKLPPQHWYLIDSSSRASCNPRKQLAIAFAPLPNTIWRSVCESKFLLWLIMANKHCNRTATLEKREKMIALWKSGSKQGQIAEEVGLSPQTVSNIVNKFLERGTYFPGNPGCIGRNEQFLPLWLLKL